jgi:hypothetical protein
MSEVDRRAMLAGTSAVAGLVTASGALGQGKPVELPAPGLVPAFSAKVTLAAPIELGNIDDVRKRIIPITGGTFAGPRIRGTVLPGGADWQFIRADGLADLNARYTLQAEDGTPIAVTNNGVRRGPAEVMRQLGEGKPVDPALYYFRAATRFQVAAGQHQWLGDSIFICSGARFPDHVLLQFFEVL